MTRLAVDAPIVIPAKNGLEVGSQTSARIQLWLSPQASTPRRNRQGQVVCLGATNRNRDPLGRHGDKIGGHFLLKAPARTCIPKPPRQHLLTPLRSSVHRKPAWADYNHIRQRDCLVVESLSGLNRVLRKLAETVVRGTIA